MGAINRRPPRIYDRGQRTADIRPRFCGVTGRQDHLWDLHQDAAGREQPTQEQRGYLPDIIQIGDKQHEIEHLRALVCVWAEHLQGDLPGGGAMNWTMLENALHAWVVSATGYPANRVLWRDRAQTRLRRITSRCTSMDHWCLEPMSSSTRPISYSHRAKRLSYLSRAIGNGHYKSSATPAQRRRAATRKASINIANRRTIALPSVDSVCAGHHTFDLGTVSTRPRSARVAFRERAVLVMRFYSRDVATEKTGYIAQVEITNTGRAHLPRAAVRTSIMPLSDIANVTILLETGGSPRSVSEPR